MIVDLHTHVLPGVDDGPATADESLAAVAAAADAGVTSLAATPHVRHDYPTTPGAMEELVRDLGERAAAAGLPTRILRGGEVALENAVAMGDDDLRRFGLGGSAVYVLIEFPYEVWPGRLASDIAGLRARGFRPVLAHPERNPEVQAAPGRLSALVDEGALVQLTALSVAGGSGPRTQRTALRLLELGLAHMLASDTHGAFRGSGTFHDAFRKLNDEALVSWLTVEVPAAVVGDDEIPLRPPARRSRFRRNG